MNKKDKEKALFKDIVLRISQESHCLSRQVAAIAVKNGRIIATGINGTPAHAENCDEFFKKEFIKGIDRARHITWDEFLTTPEFKRLHHEWSNINEIHAEQSLICEAARNGIHLEDVDIYISLQPCIHCVKLLAALKPQNIYYVNDYDKSVEESIDVLKNSNINIEKI